MFKSTICHQVGSGDVAARRGFFERGLGGLTHGRPADGEPMHQRRLVQFGARRNYKA